MTTIVALLGTVSATGLTPQYTAAEARKHIGERAIVVGEIDCIGHGRRHVDLQIGGCDLQKALLWIVVPNEVSGPELGPRTNTERDRCRDWQDKVAIWTAQSKISIKPSNISRPGGMRRASIWPE